MKWSLLLALTCAFSLCAQRQSKPASVQLPELPKVDTSGFQSVIRTQIENAEREARLQSRDPEAAGLLAMTLHAYQQYDRAAQAYSRASQLEPKNFEPATCFQHTGAPILLLPRSFADSAAVRRRKSISPSTRKIPVLSRRLMTRYSSAFTN